MVAFADIVERECSAHFAPWDQRHGIPELEGLVFGMAHDGQHLVVARSEPLARC